MLDRRVLLREPWWGVLNLRLGLGLVLCWNVCTEVTTLRLESLRRPLVLDLVQRRVRGRRASKKIGSDSKGRRARLARRLRPLQSLLLLMLRRHLLGMLLRVTLRLRLNRLLLVMERASGWVVLGGLEGRPLLLLQRTWRRSVPVAGRWRTLSGAEEWDGAIFEIGRAHV